MKYSGMLSLLPKEIKLFLGSFIIVLSLGYFTGLSFVNFTGARTPSGIEENYLGNEADPDASVMKFKKGEREILTIVHTHVLSISFIFFLVGGLLLMARLPKKLKMFLIIEPFLSIILTFGGIYLMWAGVNWMKYIVVLSGMLMTLIFMTSVLVIFYQLFFMSSERNNN
ncbi:MAG: hypothetical protein WAM00_06290 [Salegentibacter sp.]